MKQPSLHAKVDLDAILNDLPEIVHIPGTNTYVKVRGVRPYTLERLTSLWLSRDLMVSKDSAESLRELARDPYFNLKQAALFVLNGYWRIRLLFPLLWRWWAYVRGLTEAQVTPIIVAGKKKLPLMPFWTNMAYTADMRTDWVKMTRKEAEQYRRELLSAQNAPSSKNTPSTAGANTPSSSGGSVTGATAAS